jgi:hypothetical protein
MITTLHVRSPGHVHACEWKEYNILGVLDFVVSCGFLRKGLFKEKEKKENNNDKVA